jgi:hypothetical protein
MSDDGDGVIGRTKLDDLILSDIFLYLAKLGHKGHPSPHNQYRSQMEEDMPPIRANDFLMPSRPLHLERDPR